MGCYAKWLMVDGSSFFLIINGVIITSIPLFTAYQCVKPLHDFIGKFLFQHNAFRFIAILYFVFVFYFYSIL